ncbi:MAG: hypothetical protein ACTSVU_09675 [Promethearchaeota archaeon]
MAVILSIKPKYIEKMRLGIKKYEFRKNNFQLNPKSSFALIYSTSPVNKIIGSFKISEVIRDSPKNLWINLRKSSGINEKDFFSYFFSCETGTALKITELKFFEKKIDPFKEIENFNPPQSFHYLNEREFSALKKILNYKNVDEYFK